MARLLVVGNVNADRVLRLEAPLCRGDDVKAADLGYRLGGAAANTASALCRAGHTVRLVGAIGSDAAGDALVTELARWPWDARGVTRLPGPTPQCVILVEPDGERTIVSVQGHQDPPSWPEIDLDGVDAVYVGSRTPPPDGLFTAARARGIPLVWQLRPGQRPPTIPDVVVTSDATLDAAEPRAGLAALGLDADWLVVTRGAAGAVAEGDGARIEVPAVPAAVVDTTGAGDAFAAGLVHGRALGWPLRPCVEIAARWGALAVAHAGSTAPASIADAVR